MFVLIKTINIELNSVKVRFKCPIALTEYIIQTKKKYNYLIVNHKMNLLIHIHTKCKKLAENSNKHSTI